jgi:ABC-type glutathione transport system ATPase component
LSYTPPEADAADHTWPAAALSCIIPDGIASAERDPRRRWHPTAMPAISHARNTEKARLRRRELKNDMAPAFLQLKDIALTFGGAALLGGAGLSVSLGERVSLVGRNGSGKSTLLRIAAGLAEPDSGSVFLQPGALIRYLPQEPDFSGFATTRAYVEAGLTPRTIRTSRKPCWRRWT